jgi:glycosyltransferase involved in cell wall biosynthesis
MVAVSICLPVYNGKRYLSDAIESVLSQTFADFELIISDDNSTDGSQEIAIAYSAKDSRVRVLNNQQNIGLFQNYNRCLTECRGVFIKPFAQDDLLEPRMLETVVQAFEQHPDVSLIATAKRWVGEAGETLQTFNLFPKDTVITGEEVIMYNLIQMSNWVGEPSTVTFRANRVGTGFDTNLFHYGDIDYWFRIVEGSNMLYLANVLCGFRRHSGSATSKNLSGMYFAPDVLRMGEKYASYLRKLGESPEHFTKRAMEQIALNVDHLVRNEGLNLEACLAARPSQMPIDEAAAFKALAFHSMRRITDLLEEISALQHQKEALREHYEKRLSDIHSSTSWKITAPLRAMTARASSER